MQQLTFGSVKSLCAKAAGLCATDTEAIAEYVNRAQQRLLYEGTWQGTYARYKVCVRDQCITWPREIETIEAFALCSVPGTIRNGWFEFLQSGPGIMSCTGGTSPSTCGSSWCSCASNTMVDRGEFPVFDDVLGTGKKLAIYSDVTEAADAKIILQFWNSNGQWERTQFAGEWIDGESIALPAAGAYAYTINEVAPGGLVRVIKPVTNGVIRLYEYEVATALLRPLAYYAPDETIPVYRRSMIPGLTAQSGSCAYSTVEVVGKMRFIPVARDNDFLMISHMEALRLGVRALKEEESDRWNEAAANWLNAVRCLEKQLSHYLGNGDAMPIRMQGSATYGAGICNLI